MTRRVLSGASSAVLVVLTASAFLPGLGCRRPDSPAPATEQGVATLRVTREFREAVIPAVDFPCDGRSVMAILHEHAQLETSYGGGFVQVLNGIEASIDGGRNRDWFYYVNGVLAHVGAKSYRPGPGDRIWWDYHEWSENRMGGAVIGDFPQPFANGYAERVLPTVILHTPALADPARQLEKTLLGAGVREVSLLSFSAGSAIETGTSLYLIAGEWDELREHAFLRQVHDNGDRTGLFFRFTDEGTLGLLDAHGKVRSTLENGSVIAAARLGTGKDLPVWLVAGTGEAISRSACELLAKSGAVSGYAALALSEKGVLRLPYAD